LKTTQQFETGTGLAPVKGHQTIGPEMSQTNFKRGDRIRIKETGQTGTVVETRQHAPRGRSGYPIVEVVVRVDGVAALRPFQELELERIT
jgi:hypothetical protein